MPGNAAHVRQQKVIHAPEDQAMLDRLACVLDEADRATQLRIAADPEKIERDLARLVLSVIELLRQLLERQAVRRVESGVLREDEIERLGQALLRLETRMGELRAAFDLGERELTLNLGSLGNLVSAFE